MKRFQPTLHNQQALFPLNLEDLIGKEHLVRVVNSFVDEIDFAILLKPFSKEGKPPFEPRTMLKVIIYSYAIKLYSSRKIERALKQDVTYMWLSGMQTPDHNTINRFRSYYFKEVMEDVFTEMLDYMLLKGCIKFENYFTDGTKIEANANKYTHVWSKNTSRYKTQLKEKIKALFQEIEHLNSEEDNLYANEELLKLSENKDINSLELKETVSKLNEVLHQKTGIKKRSIKSKINKLEKASESLEKYEKQEELLNGRNSYSKTDPDATFMRMKDDSLQASYNVQLSTENQFITNYTVSQNAGDSSTFVEHIEKIEKRGEEYLPNNVIADSAYGSEENYENLEKRNIGNYLKYNTFYQETKGGNKNPFHKDKFVYNYETNCYTCPKGELLHYVKTETPATTTGYRTTVNIYQATNCNNCEFKDKCTKSNGNRTVQRNEHLERYKKQAFENLTSETGKKLRKQRNIDVESVFGNIKENAGFRRFKLRGKEKVTLEVGYLSLGHNLRKMQIIKQKSVKMCA